MRGQDKILCLESLRGLAALAVAVSHFRIGSTFNNGFTDNAGLMVDFFFVLSGFVIALSYQDKIKTVTHVYLFQARRFLRLYPLHLLMLFAFLGVEILKYIAESKYGLIASNPAFVKNDLWSFIQNLFLVQNLLGPDLTWNFPSWSISSEFYTYLIFAAVAVLSFGRRRRLVYISLALAGASLIYLILDVALLPSSGIVRCIYSFFLGVVIFNFAASVEGELPSAVSFLLLGVSIFATLISADMPPILFWCIPAIFSALLVSLVKSADQNPLKRVLSNKYLVFLGTISYGVYMVHALVWWVFNQTLRFVLGYEASVDAGGITRVLIGSVALSNLIMVFGLSVIVGLAYLSYRLIESPVNNFRHKLGKLE